MMNAPERIYATINGASTRLPDGGRQLVGGWSEDSDRPRSTEYVRADLHDALEAAIRRQVENIERWLETGEPASAEESKSIYEQLKDAIA